MFPFARPTFCIQNARFVKISGINLDISVCKQNLTMVQVVKNIGTTHSHFFHKKVARKALSTSIHVYKNRQNDRWGQTVHIRYNARQEVVSTQGNIHELLDL